MTTIVALLVFVVVLNSVATVALIRQIGVLHLRIHPLPALQGAGGPKAGDSLPLADELDELLSQLGSRAQRVTLGFISPTCRLCGPLLPGFQAISSHSDPGEEAVVLVSDGTPTRTAEYLSRKNINLPTLSGSERFTESGVPAAPFVVVVRRPGTVLSSGGVNTLEQIEWLIAEATKADMLSPEESDASARELSRSADVRGVS